MENNYMFNKRAFALKERLKTKRKLQGLTENFGQAEIDRFEEKEIDISNYTQKENEKRTVIAELRNWAMNYFNN
jgi:hypothetical protein